MSKVKDRNPKKSNSRYYIWETTNKSCCNDIIKYFDGYFIGRTS
jgi:hypothetical protein